MKAATKSAIASAPAQAAVATVESTTGQPSGRTETIQVGRYPAAGASLTSMTIPFLGFDMLHRRLVASGYEVPRITFEARRIAEFSQISRLSLQLTTPLSSEERAERWLRNFLVRANTDGVAEMKTRIRFDSDAIRRWLIKG